MLEAVTKQFRDRGISPTFNDVADCLWLAAFWAETNAERPAEAEIEERKPIPKKEEDEEVDRKSKSGQDSTSAKSSFSDTEGNAPVEVGPSTAKGGGAVGRCGIGANGLR